MTFRLRYLSLILLFFVLIYANASSSYAQSDGRLTAEQIKAGLRVIPEIDQGFIDSVVEKADKGELPRRILHAAYFYAIKKEEYRFQHFQRALIILAAREGIKLLVND